MGQPKGCIPHNYRSLVGLKFSRLLVIARVPNTPRGQSRWLCKCECGKEHIVVGSDLNKGHTKSCGCLELEVTSKRSVKDMIGMRFGYYVVISRVPKDPSERRQKQAKWLCRCDCGTERTIKGNSLRTGNSKSCGCKTSVLITRANTKHGHSKGRYVSEYTTWCGMRQRCQNKNSSNYKDYGGRGIKVCDRWSNYQAFLEDVGRKPPGTSLDRIDVNKGYEPGNVRWATAHEQALNKRKRLTCR